MRKTLKYRMMICMAIPIFMIGATATQATNLIPNRGTPEKSWEIKKPIFLAKTKTLSGKGKSHAARSTKTEDACETVSKRVYDLCMASPSANPSDCIDEYNNTYAKCSGNPEVTEKSTTPHLSEGVYRIPYADYTKVHIMHNFYDHKAQGKIDMAGRGRGPYRIVAAAAGYIRYIEDSRSKQQHPLRWLRNTDDCLNNYVWIKHKNGEWSKYSHMQQWTTTGKAGLKIGDFVAEGTYLGDEGKVGCAWPAHLHFEVVKPTSETPTIADTSGELSDYDFIQARNPVIAGIKGSVFKNGENYVVAAQATCKKDRDCASGEYCNAGADFTKNSCQALKNDNETCALVGGGHQCKSGKCRFSRCYTSKSVEMGGTCYNDDACRKGKCSDHDGVKGMCVCKKDSDCTSSQYCDAGFDTKINRCRQKLDKGKSCGKVGSIGNNHKCKSGKCSGLPSYKCK